MMKRQELNDNKKKKQVFVMKLFIIFPTPQLDLNFVLV